MILLVNLPLGGLESPTSWHQYCVHTDDGNHQHSAAYDRQQKIVRQNRAHFFLHDHRCLIVNIARYQPLQINEHTLDRNRQLEPSRQLGMALFAQWLPCLYTLLAQQAARVNLAPFVQ